MGERPEDRESLSGGSAVSEDAWSLWWELVGLCHENHRRALLMLGASTADLAALALATSTGGRIGQPLSGLAVFGQWTAALDATRDGKVLDEMHGLVKRPLPPASDDPQRLARGVVSHYAAVADFDLTEMCANPGSNIRWEEGRDYPPVLAEPLVKSDLLFPAFETEAICCWAILRAWPQRADTCAASLTLALRRAATPGLVIESLGALAQRATVVGGPGQL